MVLTSFSLLGSFSCYSFWLLVQAQRSLHHLPWGGLWLVGGTPTVPGLLPCASFIPGKGKRDKPVALCLYTGLSSEHQSTARLYLTNEETEARKLTVALHSANSTLSPHHEPFEATWAG